MAFVVADRVKETTTTAGTGTITLAGAATGFQSFSVIGNGNTTFYTIAGQGTSEWEVGIGTYTSSGTTLSRDTVLSSSSGGTKVSFSAGTKDVFVTYPAGRAVLQNDVSSVVISANTTSDALRVTQTGTGNALVIEDSANPDSTPVIVDKDGFTLFNIPAAITGGQVQWRAYMDGFNFSNDAVGPAYRLFKGRGTADNFTTPVQVNDVMGYVDFFGSDGTYPLIGVRLQSIVYNTPGSLDMPGQFEVHTSPDGGYTPAIRIAVNASGLLASGVRVVNTLNSGNIPSTQDAVVLAGRAGGTSSYAVTLTPTTLSANRTLTLPDASGTILQSGTAVTVAQGGTGITSGTSGGIPYFSSTSAIASSGLLSANQFVIGGGAGASPTSTTTISWSNTFTAAQTFRAANAVRSEAASTQDAVVLAGRAGGTSSYAVTLTPTTLSANRTLTLPDASGTILQSGTAVTVAQGGTGLTTTTAYGLIAAGTTSTGNFQQVSGLGTSGQVLTSNGAGALPTWQSPSGALSWQSAQTSGFTAVAGRAYPCNTTSAAFTVTLPASPSAGDLITLTDYAGTWGTNNLTVSPNGNKINGSTSNVTFLVSRQSVQFVYVDATQGWVIYSGFETTYWAPIIPIEVLIVAGGGGGATEGGGGGGGFRTITQFSASYLTNYTVTVGAGGSGGSFPSSASAGSNSVFNTVTSAGGGRGGSYVIAGGDPSGGSGGSGGGGGYYPAAGTGYPGGAGNTPSVTPSQGNSGGSGQEYAGGGGGGAGGSGGSPGGTTGGSGGSGSASSITGTSTTYSGGGGGGGSPGGGGPGGSGGGGNGGGYNAGGQAGTANTGGGGGATYQYNSGGTGGSGIVIIAYPNSFPNITSIGGGLTYSLSTTSRSGYKVYSFTAGTGSIQW